MDPEEDGILRMSTDTAPTFSRTRCFRYGCLNPVIDQCEFTDGNGNQCASVWCADHRIEVNGHMYCVRHAGIAHALDENVEETERPALNLRAPALAVWVGDHVDEHVRMYLLALGSEMDHATIQVYAIRRAVGVSGTPRWERKWTLRADGKNIVSVAIAVDEHHDSVVTARVNDGVVVRRMAPWIRHRVVAEWSDPAQEAEERQAFYDGLVDVIVRTVNASIPQNREAS